MSGDPETQSRLDNFIRSVGKLPSLPSLYLELTEELLSEDASFNRVGQILSKDLAMTSKILQVVNSAYFGIPREVSSVDRAVVLLGLEMVRNLVLTQGIFSMYEGTQLKGVTVAGLWRHSMACAGLARKLARVERASREVTDQSSTAAFLHDVGKLLLASHCPAQYAEVQNRAAANELRIHEAEQGLFGFDHADAGGHLLQAWGLPESIVEAVTFHHHPDRCRSDSLTPLTIVYTANMLDHLNNDGSPSAAEGEFDDPFFPGLPLRTDIEDLLRLANAPVDRPAYVS